MSETVTVECANCGRRKSYQSDEELAGRECPRCNYKYKDSGMNKYYPDRA